MGRASIAALHTSLGKDGRLSLRAVYKAVDKLIAAGVLIRAQRQVMLSAEWTRAVGERLRPTPLAAPALGERLSYSFMSLEHLDAFWKTVVLPIEEAATETEIFFYNPHDFWAYLPERRESEEAYYRHFNKQKRGFFTVGGDAEADMEFKRAYQSEYLQVDTRDIASLGRRDHSTLIGSLILTVRLQKRLVAQIDALYASGKPIDELLPELERLCARPGKTKLVLENNPGKAKKLRKLLSKNFYFKQD